MSIDEIRSMGESTAYPHMDMLILVCDFLLNQPSKWELEQLRDLLNDPVFHPADIDDTVPNHVFFSTELANLQCIIKDEIDLIP